MRTSKTKRFENQEISTQESLVKSLLGKEDKVSIRTIPGGKTLLQQIDKETMPMAVYTWIRSCGSFNEVTISWAKDPDQYRCKITKAHSYDTAEERLPWDRKEGARKDLAKLIANILNTRPVVKVTAKADGIYVYEAQDFSPYKILTTEDIELPEWEGHEAGERVISPDWEPHIRWISNANKNRYANVPRDIPNL